MSDKDIAQQALNRIATHAIVDAPVVLEDPELRVQSAIALKQEMLSLL